MERLIEITCGQLVYIDTQSRVHFIHETARDYLLRERDSEFAIERSVGHKRLALTCLKYLAGPGMVGGNKRRASSSIMSPNRSPFVAYASKYLSDHITFIHSTETSCHGSSIWQRRKTSIASCKLAKPSHTSFGGDQNTCLSLAKK
jgi:hypothetical protein